MAASKTERVLRSSAPHSTSSTTFFRSRRQQPSQTHHDPGRHRHRPWGVNFSAGFVPAPTPFPGQDNGYLLDQSTKTRRGGRNTLETVR
jgi:hypothetical protein